MPSFAMQRLRLEADLMERFTQTYRRKFAAMIERLNGAEAPSDLQCVRLCIEAVDMMLASQSQVVQSLREIVSDATPLARKAA